MRESKNITIILGGRTYSLTVSMSEESLVRNVVTDINEQINYYEVRKYFCSSLFKAHRII